MPQATLPDYGPQGLPAIHRVAETRVPRWLAAGWRDFRAHTAVSLGYGTLVLMLLYAALWLSWQAPQFILSFFSGLLLVGPFLATGFYEISRRREVGEPVSLRPVLFAWRRNTAGFALFAVFVGILALVWIRFTSVLAALAFIGSAPGGFALDFPTLFQSRAGLTFLAVFLLCGAMLAAAVFTCSAVALPMLLDRGASPVTAIAASVRAVRDNPAAMTVWAATIVALTGIGMATGLLALIVVLPLIGHATWHAYRDMIG